MEGHCQQARILIVDDQQINVRILERILERAGYTHIKSITESVQTFSAYAEFHPDLILLDLMMPEMDGLEVIRRLQTVLPPDTFLPILMLTADTTSESKRRALEQGAHDFVTKPFDAVEVLLRIKNLLMIRFLYLQVQEQNQRLQNQNEILDEKVRERTAQLSMAQREIVERLAQANEYRDDHTGAHIHRVGHLSALLAAQLGLPQDHVDLIHQAATLHDVGKIAIADSILLKDSLLDEAERDKMRLHTILGAKLLGHGQSDVIRIAERIAYSHHERWDGLGYPNGLKGEEIPIEGRIVAVVDVFDALTHERPYKVAWPIQEALTEIERHSGGHFDPHVVAAFLALSHESLLL